MSAESYRYEVNPELGVTVDDGGEAHTIDIAKSSRILEGNTGCFTGDRDCVLICLACKKLGYVWSAVSASQLDSAFGLKDEAESQAHAEKVAAEWSNTYQKIVSPEEIPGGGICIDDGILKSVMSLKSQFKRRCSKPYMTKSEHKSVKQQKTAQQQRQREAAAARSRGGADGRGGGAGRGGSRAGVRRGAAGRGAGGRPKRGRASLNDMVELSDGSEGEGEEESLSERV
eukprot:4269841-Pleurochrysis_carterae.AAC.4